MLRVRRLSIVALAVAASHAHASPVSDPTSGRSVFTGATLPGATSIYLDPAALGLGVANEIYLGGSAVIDQSRIAVSTLDINTGATTAGPDVHDTSFAPGGLAAAIFHLGGDSSPRFTLAVSLQATPGERFASGHDSLRYFTLGGYERTYDGAVAAAIRVTNDLYFGLSLASDVNYVQLRYARDTALAAGHGAGGVDSNCGGSPCGVGNPQATEQYDIKASTPVISTANLAANIGLIYQIAKDIWVGVGYHSPPGLAVQTELNGSAAVTRSPRDGGNTITGASTVEVSLPASVDLEFRARLPGRLDLHVGARWEDLSRFRGYDVRTYGDVFQANNVPEWTERPRGMHDPLAVWVGIEQAGDRWALGERLRLGARLGFETASVDEARESPTTIAPTSFTADVGAQLRLSQNLIVELTYGIQYFPTVTVTKSEYDPRDQIACLDNGVDYNTSVCDSQRNGYSIESGDGSYQRIEHAIRFGLRYDWF